MPKYRAALPQLEEGSLFLTDGGLETALIFHEGIGLPHFAACDLLRSDEGTEVLRAYYHRHAAVAYALGVGFSIDTPTWRANPDWTDRLGYDDATFDAVNRAGARLAEDVRRVWERSDAPVVIAANVGPRGDGYRPDSRQTAEEAADYHSRQIGVFRDTEADFVSALTMNYSEEAVGIARAAKVAGMPVTISFTVETDGLLASGETVAEAIAAVDDDTGGYPAYFMINCAHPTHLADDLATDEVTARRVRGYRANASRRSHAELDDSETLDDGDPTELGRQFRELRDRMPGLTVLGGCCGRSPRARRRPRAVAR